MGGEFYDVSLECLPLETDILVAVYGPGIQPRTSARRWWTIKPQESLWCSSTG